MRRQPITTDYESDYSDTDVSIEATTPRRRNSFRRRSVSRQPQPIQHEWSNTYLSPVAQDVRVQRSASTGGRRPHRERDHSWRQAREREREPQPPAVIVDINNDSGNRSSNKSRRSKQQHQRADEPADIFDDSEDETRLRSHRRRPVATSPGVSREREHVWERERPREYPHHLPFSPTPDYSPWIREYSPRRDYDMIIDQRLLQRNDNRQDMELMRQQQEIDRLERELARRREEQESRHGHDNRHENRLDDRIDRIDNRLMRDEDIWYEDEISDRLRRLERFEKKERTEEERRKAEYNVKMKRFEEAERLAAEQEEVQAKVREEKLKELQQKIEEEEEKERIQARISEEKLREMQRKIAEEEEKERIIKEIREEEAKKLLEEQERQQNEARMKQAAIQEWKLAEERRANAEREAQAIRDQQFRDRLRMEFGYTEEEIEGILNKKKDPPEEDKGKEDDKKQVEPSQATWIKVHRKHLLPDTLIAYRLPWDWDELDGNYIIIKQWITEDFQEELFAHSRRIRDGKLVTQTSNSLTELKVSDRNKDKLYLVRKKSPSRKSWIFT